MNIPTKLLLDIVENANRLNYKVVDIYTSHSYLNQCIYISWKDESGHETCYSYDSDTRTLKTEIKSTKIMQLEDSQ